MFLTISRQYSQCTYNVTLKRVYEAIVAVEKLLSLIYLCVRSCVGVVHERRCVLACVWPY